MSARPQPSEPEMEIRKLRLAANAGGRRALVAKKKAAIAKAQSKKARRLAKRARKAAKHAAKEASKAQKALDRAVRHLAAQEKRAASEIKQKAGSPKAGTATDTPGEATESDKTNRAAAPSKRPSRNRRGAKRSKKKGVISIPVAETTLNADVPSAASHNDSPGHVEESGLVSPAAN